MENIRGQSLKRATNKLYSGMRVGGFIWLASIEYEAEKEESGMIKIFLSSVIL